MMMHKYKISLLDTFYKSKLPEKLSEEIEKVVAKLKNTKNREECLKKAYVVLTTKYRGYRFRTLISPHILLKKDLKELWNISGFLYCNQMNYLLRLLLVKSGWFVDKDIDLKWTMIWYISPHQYCQVKLAKNKLINVDIWGRAQGFQIGDYAHGFYSGEAGTEYKTLIDFTKIKKGGIEINELISKLKKSNKK